MGTRPRLAPTPFDKLSAHRTPLSAMRVSILADYLNNIVNAEKRGKRQVLIRPSSKVIIRYLTVMQKHGYIEEFEEVDDHRFNIRLPDIEKWVALLLPSRSFGFIILTTSAGIMDHEEARRKHVAGKVLGFVY